LHICWGTIDEGINSASWQHNENLNVVGLGTYKMDISSLNPETTYYYRCYATNSVGTGWASSSVQLNTLSSDWKSGRTTPGATNWKAEGSSAIYVDVDTSAAEFPSTPLYFTSLWGTGNHWNAQGINAVYRARSAGFRIYLKSNTGVALTPAYANRQGWCVQWLGVIPETNTCSGFTPKGATNWKAEGSKAIYVDVDTSAAEFPSTPIYFTSLGGSGNHWNAQGINAVYRARPTGFRIYLKSVTGATLTPTYANSQGWNVQWLGVVPETNSNSGSTPKGTTNWKTEGSKAIYVDVDTSAAEFPSTPFYFTSLWGTGNHWNAQGINAVYRARSTGFRIYLKSNTGTALTPAYANRQGWCVQWLGV
jgi:RES domain-containing protein